MADLPSILGGMAQGFVDFGKSAVDLFGTGGAAIGDLADTIRTGKVSTKNQDDFRKWLYNTDSVQDAAAKGLGTALNGAQTVADYIPGIGAVTKNPLFNAGQGALGGLADEFKTYGKDYDLGRAGERAAVSAGAALASGGLGDALKKSANPLLSSGTVQGLARGATGGAITGGGYAAVDGGDVLQSALQGAGTGALIGGATGAFQDFKPAKTYDMGLTDAERASRLKEVRKMRNAIGPEKALYDGTLDDASAARWSELWNLEQAYKNGFDNYEDYHNTLRPTKGLDDETLGLVLKNMNEPELQPWMQKGSHQPTFDPTMSSLASSMDRTVSGESFMPDDFYQHMDWYGGGDTKPYLESASAIQKIRGNPNAKVTMYRATVGDKIYPNDWVTLSPEYAKQHLANALRDQPDAKIIKQTVAARDLRWPGDDINEFGYYPITNGDIARVKGLETTLADADMAVNSAKPAPERYIDSAGEEVPQALADYFKDASPLVRDENGNLIRFYHGTPNGSFDSPAGGSYFTPNKEYADVYQSPNASSISFGKKATNPATYEAYLDLRKPFDISDPEARRIYINEYVKGGNATGINPYQNNYDDVKNIDWTEVEGLKEFLEGTGYGYDSIIADEGGVPDGNGGVVSRGKSYIPFESSQVFTLKKNLAQPMEAPVAPVAEGGGSLGAVDMSGAGENSKYFMDKYGDAIAKAGAGDDPEAMAALMMKRGNKDMVRDAFTTQQDSANGTDMYRVFREYGGSKPAARETLANALTGASANPPELVGYHGVDSEKLKKAINNFGGDIINPSLQIVNPEVNPGVKYGDVILLGNKDMYFNQGKYGLIDDTGKTNAYSRDVYSPRVPDFEEKNGNRYIAGTRTPYTAENVSKYMNKQGVKSVESTWTTPGSVAATQSHRFNNLSDILDYADQLGPKDTNKKAFDDFGDFLEKKVWDYAEKNDLMGDNRYSTVEYITSELQDALKGKYSPDDYYGLRTKAGQQLISDVRKEINKLPTDYFELKMNRPVGLKEFSGAILPQGYDDQEILAALKDAGVEVLGNYDQNNMDATLQDTLKNLTSGKNRFKTPYMLGLAGLLGGGAYMASQNNDKEKEVK